MKNKKVWTVTGLNELYSDVELRSMITSGKLTPLDEICSEELDEPVLLKDSIYNSLFKEKKDDQTV